MYKTGTANNLDELFDNIALVAQEVGFASQRQSDKLVLDKESAFFCFQYFYMNRNNSDLTGAGTTIELYLLENYTANTYFRALNKGPYIICNYIFYPFLKWYAFYTTEYIYFTVEMRAGLFFHFGIVKVNNTWCVYGSTEHSWAVYNGHVLGENTLLLSNNIKRRIAQPAYNINRSNDFYAMGVLHNCSPSASTGITTLIPLLIFDKKGNDSITFIGQAPDIRAVNVYNYLPGESMFLGNDEWVVFPLRSKRFPDEDFKFNNNKEFFNSDLFGVAYRKTL